MTWSVYRPKAKMNVLDTIFPEGISDPGRVPRPNIVHLPTVKCVAGDTEVVLGDGTRVAIRDLVNGQLARAGLVSIDDDGTVHAPGYGDRVCDGQGGACASARKRLTLRAVSGVLARWFGSRRVPGDV